jgi:hypothetical protein
LRQELKEELMIEVKAEVEAELREKLETDQETIPEVSLCGRGFEGLSELLGSSAQTWFEGNRCDRLLPYDGTVAA